MTSSPPNVVHLSDVHVVIHVSNIIAFQGFPICIRPNCKSKEYPETSQFLLWDD